LGVDIHQGVDIFVTVSQNCTIYIKCDVFVRGKNMCICLRNKNQDRNYTKKYI